MQINNSNALLNALLNTGIVLDTTNLDSECRFTLSIYEILKNLESTDRSTSNQTSEFSFTCKIHETEKG